MSFRNDNSYSKICFLVFVSLVVFFVDLIYVLSDAFSGVSLVFKLRCTGFDRVCFVSQNTMNQEKLAKLQAQVRIGGKVQFSHLAAKLFTFVLSWIGSVC